MKPTPQQHSKQTIGWFITGTDTEIGKTLIASALLHTLSLRGVRVAGMKPIAAGAVMHEDGLRNEDAEQLAAAASVILPAALATPFLLSEPVAPHVAATLEDVQLKITHILDCFQEVCSRAECVVVEGVGGFRVPLSDMADTADLAQQLSLPVILVVGMRLGCLNHALLTAEALTSRGLTLAGWVANVVDPEMIHRDANIAALKQRLKAPLLGIVPRLSQANATTAAEHIDFSQLHDWCWNK
jgi:dethiobiotin synthetase